MTVQELLFEQIIKTHNKFVKEGSIPLYDGNLKLKQEIFRSILLNDH